MSAHPRPLINKDANGRHGLFHNDLSFLTNVFDFGTALAQDDPVLLVMSWGFRAGFLRATYVRDGLRCSE